MNQRPLPGDLCLDHVAHFVPDLAAAARDLEKLGLVVTPESAHRTQHGPAGTSNRCVMLEQGYIEILAPNSETAVYAPHVQRVRERMERFVGVHLCCFGTSDPATEQARLAAHGFEPEPMVNLARTLRDGTPVRFNVVYVPAAKMPEGRVQYCEHLTEANLWRKEWVNPGLRLEAAFVVADDPAGVAARWGRFSGVLPRRDGELVELPLARGKVVIGTRAALARLLGDAPAAPAFAGYALSSGKPQEKRIVKLPPSLGGVWLIG